MKIKAGEIAISAGGNVMFRLNKDGTLDQRYAAGKRFARYDAERGIISKKIKKQARKRRVQRKVNKGIGWLEKLLGISMMVGAVVLLICDFSKGGDASLFRTASAKEPASVSYEVTGKKAYLENPQTLAEIKDYMRFKFGGNYQVACMVAYGESLRNPKATSSKPLECSTGVFQINIKDGYCLGNKVHWDKVVGASLEDKIAWLQNPKNNIDLAYKMSDKGTNWGHGEHTPTAHTLYSQKNASNCLTK
jgi:hypothetical protein